MTYAILFLAFIALWAASFLAVKTLSEQALKWLDERKVKPEPTARTFTITMPTAAAEDYAESLRGRGWKVKVDQ